ncbi:lysophospholipid transporter LplT [Trinickia soli]|jgi:MFS family permease|uniref:Lysophospholipid transporter LplT n=1 Tax=Trinickia soli TaxID=380675 RepID=A0A2N7VEF2_9BURK|nr:lysophospholipid transporter LplT [Trinickia soli]PMS15541.1 lysophospholipid transporter LplT [Trinickia soli]CAB3643442.1 Lysophospholipid transporter LplT [Trinickia soli]
MKKGFYTIIAAQFVSSLADNALLIAAIALLGAMHAASWWTPLLQILFTTSYVVLAPFAGAFADALQKRYVMFAANALKAAGCAMMLAGVHPMIAYGVVGIGAAAYSPAKYGILTELLPARRLVAANAWLESATVLSTIVGTALGGALISARAASVLSRLDWPFLHRAPKFAMFSVMLVYAAAALVNIGIPDTGARYTNRLREPERLVGEFIESFNLLWRDELAQIALWVTTLMWGAAVTLQLLVLKWAGANLGLSLSAAALMQGATGIGVAIGAGAAARLVPLARALGVLPVGIVAGVVTAGMAFYGKWLFPSTAGLHLHGHFIAAYIACAFPLMIGLGALAGYFIVPMNALLQHRGATLITAGHSIAVQNFNQNLAVLLMLGAYALLLRANVPVQWVIVTFGAFICTMIWLARRRSKANARKVDLRAMIED